MNKIQIYCNSHNTAYSSMLKTVWIKMKEDTKRIKNIEKEKRELILIILVIKQNEISVPVYLYNRLSELDRVIRFYENEIKEHWISKQYFAAKLTIS